MEKEMKAPIPNPRNHTCIRGCCQSERIPLFVEKPSIHIISKIAEGTESIVYKATWDGRLVALKKPKLSTVDDIDRFHKELQLLIKLQHPNIVSLVAAHAHPPDYMLLFDVYEDGNLSHALHVLGWKFSLEQILIIFIQLGSALLYLHKQGVVHRDVKPANILLDSKRGAHLADFGLAAYAKDLEKPSLGNWKSVGKPTGGFYKRNMVGSLLYMAPEILSREIHTEKSDIYGLGITINEILTGTIPYTDLKTEAQAHTILEMTYTEQQLVAAITSGLRPVLAGLEHACVPSLTMLITRCWHGDASERPSLDLVLEHVSNILMILNSEHDQLIGDESLEVDSPQALELSLVGEDEVVQDDLYRIDTENFVPDKVHSLVTKWGADLEDVYRPSLSWGVFATCGGRETMEDTNFILPNMGGTEYTHAFGVLDGHRGAEAAKFAANAIPKFLSIMQPSVSPLEALSTSFLEADSVFRLKVEAQRHKKKDGGMGWHPGCTAATVLFTKNRVFAANAGDCKIVLCRKGKAVALSTDHTANCIKERDRVVRAGGHVAWQVDSWRVGSAGLQVTRSIGDDDLKPAVTAEPEIFEATLTPDDEFLVIASDGLWDSLSIEDAISVVKNTVKDAALCSKRLATEAVERGSTDNITVIVIFLRPVFTLERVYYEG